MHLNALQASASVPWPAFTRHVELMKDIAAQRGVLWAMTLDDRGYATSGTAWALHRLNASIVKHALTIGDFSVMNDVRDAAAASGVPLAKLPCGAAVSPGWQDVIKALVVSKVVVEQRIPRGVAALSRAVRALASVTGVEPWELRAEDVNRLLSLRPMYRKDIRTFCAYVDEHFLSRATPIRALISPAAPVTPELATALGDRTHQQKLPARDALYELVRVVWTESPQNHLDKMRFLAIRLMILTGLRINEVTYLPCDCIRTEMLTVAATGASADSIGGNSEVMWLRYFAEKTQARPTAAHLVEKRQFVPERFRSIVQQTVEEARSATEGLRATLRNQFRAGGRHLWQFADEDVIEPRDVLSKFNRPKSNSRRMLGAKIGIPESDMPEKLTAGFIEHRISKLKRMKSDFRTFKLAEGQLNTADLLFLISAANPFAVGENLDNYLAVTVLGDMQISVAMGIKGRELSVFGKYSKDEKLKDAQINPHALRHLMNTELFRMDVSDTIITHHFGRETIAQTYEYDHRSLLERLDRVDLPQSGMDIVGTGSAEIVAKLVLGGYAEESHIAKTFRLVQKEHGDEVAFQYLKANGDGFHVTPYGFCTNSFSMNPCSRHLKCFDNCSHFVASGSEEHKVSLEALRRSIVEGRAVALSKPAKTAGRKNQIAHADSLIKGIEAALVANAGTCVFPNGVDHSSPKKEIFE